MRTTYLNNAAALAAIALLCACSGHSGVVPSTSHTLSSGAAQATLHVKIPAPARTSTARHTQYISAATQSVSLQISQGSTTYPIAKLDTAPNSPGCAADQDGNTECTITVPAVAGKIEYTVNAYDGIGGSGNLLATATASMTVVAGQANTFNVTLDGVPATFKETLAQSSVTSGTASDVGLTIAAYDAAGDLIVNSPAYWNAVAGSAFTDVTISVNDSGEGASEFTLQQNGTTLPTVSGDPSTYQVTLPFSNLTVHYTGNGKALGTFTLKTPAGAADQAELTVAAPPPTITEYDITGAEQHSEFGIAADNAGNAWFTITGYYPRFSDQGAVGEMAPDGSIVQLSVTPEDHTGYGIALGPDGNFWLSPACISFTNAIHVVNGAGAYQTEYPLAGSCQNGQIIAGDDGNLWFSEAGNAKVGKITAGGAVTEYAVSGAVGGVTNGPVGYIWFTEPSAGKIGNISPSGQITEYPVTSGNTPEYITEGSDGNLWFTEETNVYPYWGAIGKMTPQGQETDYNLPYSRCGNCFGMQGIVTGPDGNLWFGDYGVVGQVTPATGAIKTYAPAINPGAICMGGQNEQPFQFVSVPSQNALWFTDRSGCIGKIALH